MDGSFGKSVKAVEVGGRVQEWVETLPGVEKAVEVGGKDYRTEWRL